MRWKSVFCAFILSACMTASLEALPLADAEEPLLDSTPSLPGNILQAASLGNCNTYNNSTTYYSDYVAHCAGTGPGCTECVNFPGGGTVGTCYVVDANTTICIYNQIAPWTNL